MFFKKKPEPQKLEYSTELDALRDKLSIIIDLSMFKGKILSIEREYLNDPNERTLVSILKEDGSCDEYTFEISRNQHAKLVQQYSKPTTATNS